MWLGQNYELCQQQQKQQQQQQHTQSRSGEVWVRSKLRIMSAAAAAAAATAYPILQGRGMGKVECRQILPVPNLRVRKT